MSRKRSKSKRRKKRKKKRKKSSLPWAGWKELEPDTAQRTVMLNKCGHRQCFFGPGKSFPRCIKNTCKRSKKADAAAYIRAREYGQPRSSYKGKSRPRYPRSVYQKIAIKARRSMSKGKRRKSKSKRRKSKGRKSKGRKKSKRKS